MDTEPDVVFYSILPRFHTAIPEPESSLQNLRCELIAGDQLVSTADSGTQPPCQLNCFAEAPHSLPERTPPDFGVANNEIAFHLPWGSHTKPCIPLDLHLGW